MPSGPRLAAVRPHLHGDPCPSGSEPLILTYNFGILHILSQNARFMLNLTGQLGWPTLYGVVFFYGFGVFLWFSMFIGEAAYL